MTTIVLVGGPFDGEEKRSEFVPTSTSIVANGSIAFYHSRKDWATCEPKRDSQGRVMMFYSAPKPELVK